MSRYPLSVVSIPIRKAGRRKCALLDVICAALLASACQAAAPTPEIQPVIPFQTAPAAVTRVVTMVPYGATRVVIPASTPVPDPRLEHMPAIQLTIINSEEWVNLRSGPSSLNDIVGRVKIGTTVNVVAVSPHGEWLALRNPEHPDQLAWVYIHFTNYDPAVHMLPSLQPKKVPEGFLCRLSFAG